MIRTIARDYFFASGKQFCHFHGVFVCFRATQRKKCFRQARNFGEFLTQQTARLGSEPWSRKTQFIDLLLDCLQHFGMLVANI